MLARQESKKIEMKTTAFGEDVFENGEPDFGSGPGSDSACVLRHED